MPCFALVEYLLFKKKVNKNNKILPYNKFDFYIRVFLGKTIDGLETFYNLKNKFLKFF